MVIGVLHAQVLILFPPNVPGKVVGGDLSTLAPDIQVGDLDGDMAQQSPFWPFESDPVDGKKDVCLCILFLCL